MILKKIFNISNYEINRPLPTGKKVIGLMKDELGTMITAEFVVLRPKTYTYLIDNGSGHKKLKEQKNA